MNGHHARVADLTGAAAARPLALPRVKSRSIPFEFPSFVLSPLGIRAFNAVFYAAHPSRTGCIVDYDNYFYPLDRVQHWNRMYGKRGFAQYQATFPKSEAGGLKRLLERLSLSQRASFLAVLKCFGPANPGPLSYPFEGYTLSLDLPNHGVLAEFLRELDHIVLDHGGRVYTAKDCATTAASFAKMYPRLDEFKAIQIRLDPQRRLASDMARRLGIVEG
jgi:FAD/FMN-containing dehydrogenase